MRPSSEEVALTVWTKVMAVHSDAAVKLFPYNASMDMKCSWVSQWK